jgi:hypothetical protein
MRKLRLSIVLPLIQCGLEALLQNWASHQQATVPGALEGTHLPAALVLGGDLNAPASYGATFTYDYLYRFCDLVWPQRVVHIPGFDFVFFLLVVVSWYLIGRWLDFRVAGTHQKESTRPIVRTLRDLFRFLIVGLGLFFLAASFHLIPTTYVEIISRALLQTWAVLLIGVPCLGFLLRVRQWLGGANAMRDPVRVVSGAATRLSNLQCFLAALGIFAALTIAGFLATGHSANLR